MNLIKKLFLYIFGIVLIAFGNRKFFQNLFANTENGNDAPKQEDISFDIMKLQYHPEKDSLSNQDPFFQIMRYDPAQTYSNSKIETDHAETATASS